MHPKEHIVRAAISSDNYARTARELGINRKTVEDIAKGKTCADILPGLPRRGCITCHSCVHYSGNACKPCSLGVPEANTVKLFKHNCGKIEHRPSGNTRAARGCSAYIKAEQG